MGSHAHDGTPENGLPTVVVLRPIGSPLTVGLAGLGIASFIEGGLALGWVPHDETSQVGIVLIAVPFVLQLLACVLCYLARDGASAAVTGVLATTWLALGLVHLQSGSPARDAALGLLMLGAGAAVALSAGTVARANPLAASIFVLAALRFLTDGVYELGAGSAWQHAGGIIGLLVAGAVLYAAPAFELEGQQHSPVLPTLRQNGRARGGRAAAGQLEGVVDEPGVRETA
jgi:uncharacterized protein